MAADVPARSSGSSVTVTVLSVPTPALPKAAVTFPAGMERESPASHPVNISPPVLTEAAAVPSYTLLSARNPLTVTVFLPITKSELRYVTA